MGSSHVLLRYYHIGSCARYTWVVRRENLESTSKKLTSKGFTIYKLTDQNHAELYDKKGNR